MWTDTELTLNCFQGEKFYAKPFQILQNKGALEKDEAPLCFMTDYEKVLMNAASSSLPWEEVNPCDFP